MSEPPTPTPGRPGEEGPPCKSPTEGSCAHKPGLVCCSLQTVLLVMTLVNTALLCIILGCLIGHR